MATDYTFKIIGDKQVEIYYKGKRKLRFQLKQKRAFFVFTKLLEKYPDYLNLHELDADYSDPNKAYSELKLTDGFLNFVSEKKGVKKVMTARIELDKLFNQFHPSNSDQFIQLTSVDPRSNLTDAEKETIYKNFSGICNITKVKLLPDRQKHTLFMKQAITPAYDHRIPLFRGGDNTLENIQLISEQANQEKRKICISCKNVKCEECALAFPEDYTVIQANFQDISEWRT